MASWRMLKELDFRASGEVFTVEGLARASGLRVSTSKGKGIVASARVSQCLTWNTAVYSTQARCGECFCHGSFRSTIHYTMKCSLRSCSPKKWRYPAQSAHGLISRLRVVRMCTQFLLRWYVLPVATVAYSSSGAATGTCS